jgi:hypothetical protein
MYAERFDLSRDAAFANTEKEAAATNSSGGRPAFAGGGGKGGGNAQRGGGGAQQNVGGGNTPATSRPPSKSDPKGGFKGGHGATPKWTEKEKRQHDRKDANKAVVGNHRRKDKAGAKMAKALGGAMPR